MINIETIEVSGFEGAIKGMRNPFKNRDKSDSGWAYSHNKNGDIPVFNYEIGPKDLQLCQKLLASGKDDDSKFMRMIHVQADITAPLYWWKEMDTYGVATVKNSESTMHTIHMRPFTEEDFAMDMLIDDYTLTEDKKNFIDEYDFDYLHDGVSDTEFEWYPASLMDNTIQGLNIIRDLYLKARDAGKKFDAYALWYQMIKLLPSAYLQKRTVDLNYQTLRRIFFARRHHKLKEWSCDGFCDWISSLPYAEELICYKGNPGHKYKIVKKEDGSTEYIPLES